MLRRVISGSVRSRRFAGLSDSRIELELRRLPIDARGSETTLDRPLRVDLDDHGLPLIAADVGPVLGGRGPVDSNSLIEKDLRGAVLSSKCAICCGNGEEAVLCGASPSALTELSPRPSTSSSSSTSTGLVNSFADTSVGVYLRSGNTRLIGFGIPVILRRRDCATCSDEIRGVK
jgi:hypothetical protein